MILLACRYICIEKKEMEEKPDRPWIYKFKAITMKTIDERVNGARRRERSKECLLVQEVTGLELKYDRRSQT